GGHHTVPARPCQHVLSATRRGTAAVGGLYGGPARRLSAGLALDRVAGLDTFVEQRIRETLREAPLGEALGRLLELARHPAVVDDVGVEVVLGRAAARIVEVPEVAG